MQTHLSGAQITELTKALTDLSLGRLATAAKTAQRFQRFLAQHIGEDRAATAAPAILQSADPELARRRLAAALAPLSPAPAPADAGDSAGHGSTCQPLAAVKAAFQPAIPKGRARFAALETVAKEGQLPAPPDFSAPTHARFRARLGQIVALAETGDIAGLKAVVINPVSSSPKAMARYRDLCVIALEARAS